MIICLFCFIFKFFNKSKSQWIDRKVNPFKRQTKKIKDIELLATKIILKILISHHKNALLKFFIILNKKTLEKKSNYRV
jgi:hypothetical protein